MIGTRLALSGALAFLCACGDDVVDPRADGGVDAGRDAGSPRDLGIDQGRADASPRDLGADASHDLGRWEPDAGWERVASAGCPLARATDPSAAYPMVWEPCPDGQPCQMQVPDPRYDNILAKLVGQRLDGAPVVLGFLAFEPGLPRDQSELTFVLTAPEGPAYAAWRAPRPAEVIGRRCHIATAGTDGVHAAVEVSYREDVSSALYHETLANIPSLDREIGRLDRFEQLGAGIQYLKVSATHAMGFMGALVWIFDTDGTKQRRGGPLDGLGAPWVFAGSSTVTGPSVVAILDARLIAVLPAPAAAPVTLYEAPERIRLVRLADDGVHLTWLERDIDTDTYELWTSPHALTPEEFAPRRLMVLDSVGNPIVGDGLVATPQFNGDLIIVDIADGRTRRFDPTFMPEFDLRGVTRDELFLSAVVPPDMRTRFVRVDLDALPYTD